VIYPHHGAALIEEINTRTILGEEKVYLKLRVAQGDLTIQVPVANVELVGVRDVVGRDGLERVFEVLRADVREEPTNWSRRYKANIEKIASGDVIKVSEVVRDLSRRDSDRGLSAGEKRMLSRARQILVSELALAEDIPEEAAEARLDEILAAAIGGAAIGGAAVEDAIAQAAIAEVEAAIGEAAVAEATADEDAEPDPEPAADEDAEAPLEAAAEAE
jgi:CarD family transcriptional regulator